MKLLALVATIALITLQAAAFAGPPFQFSATWRVDSTMGGSAVAYHTRPWATWLLTCAHVVVGSSNPDVCQQGTTEPVRASVVALTLERGMDCAVLKVPVGSVPIIPLGTDPAVGDRLHAFGLLSGTDGLYTDGVYMGRFDSFNMMTGQLGGGSSGGPVVGDDGRLAGIVFSTLHPFTRQPGNGFVMVGRIREWLKRQRLLPPTEGGARLTPLPRGEPQEGTDP